MDKHQIEIRRLKYQVKAWMRTAVVQMFGPRGGPSNASSEMEAISNLLSPNGEPSERDDIFQRPEVLEYISTINEVRCDINKMVYDY
jgi:hypothetical protein